MIDENIMQRNVLAYLVSRVNWLSGTIIAIVGIWLRDDLSFSQILLLQGLFALMVIGMEVPTGIIADLMERRKVLMFGYLNASIGLVLYAFLRGFYGFLLAEFFFAIGMASISGADTAAIWDTYLENGKEEAAHKIIANGKIVYMGSAIVLTVLGGILAAYSLSAPLYIASVGVFSNMILYGRSYETARPKVESAKVAWIKSMNLFTTSKFREAFILGLLMTTVLQIVFWAYLPKLEDYNLDPFWFGFVYAGANVIAVVTTYIIRKQENGKYSHALVAVITSVIGVFLFAIDNSLVIVIIAIGFHQIGRGIIGVIMPIKINQVAESDIRASATSLMSMVLGSAYFIVTVSFDFLSMSRAEIMTVNFIISMSIMGIWLYQKLISGSEVGLSKTVPTGNQ